MHAPLTLNQPAFALQPLSRRSPLHTPPLSWLSCPCRARKPPATCIYDLAACTVFHPASSTWETPRTTLVRSPSRRGLPRLLFPAAPRNSLMPAKSGAGFKQKPQGVSPPCAYRTPGSSSAPSIEASLAPFPAAPRCACSFPSDGARCWIRSSASQTPAGYCFVPSARGWLPRRLHPAARSGMDARPGAGGASLAEVSRSALSATKRTAAGSGFGFSDFDGFDFTRGLPSSLLTLWPAASANARVSCLGRRWLSPLSLRASRAQQEHWRRFTATHSRHEPKPPPVHQLTFAIPLEPGGASVAR